jgi:hypothetical protein
MTIELNIKTVSLKVTETSPIVVYWARGTYHNNRPIFLMNHANIKVNIDR